MEIQRSTPSQADMDVDSTELVLKLQLDDVAAILAKTKGKQREGTAAPDSEIAVLAYREELMTSQQIASDRRVAQELDPLGENTEEALEQAQRCLVRAPAEKSPLPPWGGMEGFGRRFFSISNSSKKLADYAAATSIGESSSSGSSTGCQSETTISSNPSNATELSAPDIQNENAIEGSHELTATGELIYESRETATKCVVCYDEIPTHDIIQLACEHHYCRGCLQKLFTHAPVSFDVSTKLLQERDTSTECRRFTDASTHSRISRQED